VTTPVLALQSDAEKILAVYADGTIRCWDVLTGQNHYEMQGRSSDVTSLQFDETR
jgi:WD40 repeat protein